MTRSLRLRRLRPALLCVAVYSVGLAAWQLALEPRLPQDPRGPRLSRGDLVAESGEIGPFYVLGDPATAEILVVGDSRVQKAMMPETLEPPDRSRVAVLWGPGGQILGLLPLARELGPRKLVIALAPLSLFSARAAAFWERFREERDAPLARRIDELLAEEFAEVRLRAIATIRTDTWGRGWVFPKDPLFSNYQYSLQLDESTRQQRDVNLDELERSLRALVQDGFEVACVRLPISDELFAIEQAALRAPELQQICNRLGIPFLDEAHAPYETYDGAHLAYADAVRFGRDLVARLRTELGW